MNTLVTILLVVASLLLAAWAGLQCAKDRFVDGPQLLGSAVVLLISLAQLVVGVVALAGGEHPAGGAVTFVSYLAGCLLAPPAALLLALGERSRWGSAIIGAGGVLVAVLVLRLDQVWGRGLG